MSQTAKSRLLAALGAGLVLAGSLIGAPAAAQPADPGASEWVVGERARARLISSVTGVGDLETLQLGLEVVLEEGWKTYWRSPGDAGVAPHIDWAGSANFGAASLAYPAPRRFNYYEFETFGYHDRVVYPIEMIPASPGQAVGLKADVALLVCDDVCIPHEMALDLALPAGPVAASEFANLIGRFVAQVPGDGTSAGLRLEDAVLSGSDQAPVLRVAFAADTPFAAPDLLVEGPEFVRFSPPLVERDRDGKRILVTVTAADSFGAERDLELTSMPLTVTLLDGDRTMEAAIAPQFGAAPSFNPADFGAGSASVTSFVAILVLALFGGLILNLMPCVLPVLSIKLLAVVGHGGDDPREVRRGFLATSAGIVVAFLVLAAFLIGLKALGMAAGWGIQFQQPAFVITLILILVLFAANMWGLYEVRLPGRVSDAAAAGSAGGTPVGHFFSGVFATVLATPCSAPFLGTAVGFALSRGATDILAVFAALGVGMALPFLAVAAVPRVATMLPKPGQWMLTLKRAMALALLATAVWLTTVLAVQVSLAAALFVAGLMALAVAAIALRGRLPDGSARAVPAAVVVLAVAAYAVPVFAPADHGPQGIELRGNVAWVPFDRDAIPSLVAAGNVVFVDVTADWCITCLVNKSRVLNRGDVAAVMEGDNVIAMKADWTQPNPDIAAYLASHNRFGIPFNVIYGPAAPAGVTLPELLSTDAVLTAFDRAGLVVQVAETVD